MSTTTNNNEETFDVSVPTPKVTIIMPDGSSQAFTPPVTIEQVHEIATSKGIKRYFVKVTDTGAGVKPKDFPLTSGAYSIHEKNEAKA